MRALWLVVLAGCFRPTPPEGVSCGANGACPAPLHCENDLCVVMSPPPDGTLDDAPDAALPACAPVPSQAFGAPVLSPLSSAVTEGTPTLTADLLDVYFKSTRLGGKGDQDIWHAHRATVASPWDTPVPVTEVNTAAADASPEISADGLTLWIASNRAGGLGDYDFYVATRAARSDPFSTPAPVLELNSPALEEGLVVSPSGTIGYLHSLRDGAIDVIYRTTRASPTATWSTPVAVIELMAFGDNANPWVTPDDCTMYFASDHAGGLGMHDLYVATRGVPGAPFGTPAPLTSLASTHDDEDPCLSPDQQTILFVSDRPGAGIKYDIYQAMR